jgi:hypothetical protein
MPWVCLLSIVLPYNKSNQTRGRKMTNESNIKKNKYKCTGCGIARICRVETNQEESNISYPIEDLKCILDPTNATGYHWEYDND